MAFLARFRRADEQAHKEGEYQPARRRRYLPPPSLLRRERRALLRYREQRIRDLGGLVLEMYRQDRFRQDVVHEEAAQVVALEDRLREVDRLLAARANRTRQAFHCPGCGTPLHVGARFCPTCGRQLVAPAK
jgi:hypothetical protein